MSRRAQVYKLRGDFKSLASPSPYLHRFHLSTLEINDLSFSSRHWRSNILETLEEHNLEPPSLNFKGMEREKWKKKMEMELRGPRDMHCAAHPASMSSSSSNSTISTGDQWGQTETTLTSLSRKILPGIKWFLKPGVAGSRLSCQKLASYLAESHCLCLIQKGTTAGGSRHIVNLQNAGPHCHGRGTMLHTTRSRISFRTNFKMIRDK